MNLEQFEAAFIDLCERYGVDHAVIVLRCGQTQRLYGVAGSPEDIAAVEILSERIGTLMDEIKPEVQAAMDAAGE